LTTSTLAASPLSALKKNSNWPLFAILAGVVALALFIVISERLTAPFKASQIAPVAQSMELRFVDGPKGEVQVVRHRDNALVSEFVGQASFVRTVLRTLVHERLRQRIGPEQPFRLSLLKDGRLTLIDPTTERGIELEAFGVTNAAQFAALLKHQ
jgi:putative photosynthetic complex assembly protein